MVSILIFLLLLFLSFTFSGCEAALFSVLRIELDRIKRGFGSRCMLELKNREQLTLFVLLFSNTVVNAYAASLFSALSEGYLKRFGFSFVPEQFLDVVFFTVLILITGEVTPKLLAVRFPVKMLRFFSIIVYPFYFLLKPLVRILPSKIVSMKRTDAFEDVIDELEELSMMSDPVLRSRISVVHAKVGDLMTPRDDVVYLRPEDKISRLLEEVGRHRYANYPVIEGAELLGVLRLRDSRLYDASPEDTVKDYMVACPTVPITAPLLNLLKMPQEDFFAVVDEYGNFVGVITHWDILKRLNPEPKLRWIGKKSLIVPGDISLHDFEIAIKRRLSRSAPTLQALIMEETDRIPLEGEVIVIEGIRFEILEKELAKIKKIKVELR
jgi:CBS domain containing-hemolysin-like protein